MSYGDTLSRLCGMHRLEQRELAEMSGISKQTVTMIIREQNQPRIDTLERLFEVFGLEPIKDFKTVVGSAEDYVRIENRIEDWRSTR